MNSSVKISAVLLALITMVSLYSYNHPQSDSFEEWKQKFNVQIEQSEESYRRLIFLKNFEIIQKHNSDSTQTYKMGVNQFTIYTENEFRARFLGEIKS
jgi:hypothetical protein